MVFIKKIKYQKRKERGVFSLLPLSLLRQKKFPQREAHHCGLSSPSPHLPSSFTIPHACACIRGRKFLSYPSLLCVCSRKGEEKFHLSQTLSRTYACLHVMKISSSLSHCIVLSHTHSLLFLPCPLLLSLVSLCVCACACEGEKNLSPPLLLFLIPFCPRSLVCMCVHVCALLKKIHEVVGYTQIGIKIYIKLTNLMK